MFTLYTHNTPNGYKVSIALEELGLPYQTRTVDVRAGAQFSPDFLALNPNAKIPVLVDHETGRALAESCAILLYLADKTGRLLPTGAARWEALQWLFFQAASVGPMLGQRAHFALIASDKLPYAIDRYTREVERLYGVMDGHLRDRSYFLDEYSIVDIAHYGWLHTAQRMGFSLAPYPALAAWHDLVATRPAVRKGITVPSPLPF